MQGPPLSRKTPLQLIISGGASIIDALGKMGNLPSLLNDCG